MASKLFHFTTVANTNPVPVPNSGNSAAIAGYEMSNTAATAMWAKFYWGTTFSSGNAFPTVGTDLPIMTVPLAAGTSTAPARSYNAWPADTAPRGNGTLFMSVTGAQADNDNTPPAAGAVITVMYW